jgi:hypothetical protein
VGWLIAACYPSSVANSAALSDGFALDVSKSVPQWLKPSCEGLFTARLNPCPSCRDAFSLSFGAVAPNQQFVQNAPQQGLKPVIVSSGYGTTKVVP